LQERDPESKFWKRLQKKEFTVCVEIDPPKGIALDRIYEQVDRVMASKKVDAIDINSGAMARVGMDALVVAGALEARGIETVPHLTTATRTSSACKRCFSAPGPSAACAMCSRSPVIRHR